MFSPYKNVPEPSQTIFSAYETFTLPNLSTLRGHSSYPAGYHPYFRSNLRRLFRRQCPFLGILPRKILVRLHSARAIAPRQSQRPRIARQKHLLHLRY